MYLYTAKDATNIDGKPPRLPPTFGSKIINREIVSATIYKQEQRDTTSSKLQIKGPKQAEALRVAELQQFRKQLNLLSENLREEARVNYLLTQANNQRELQEFQCKMLVKLELLLKQRLAEANEDYRKFRIGGGEDATYGE
jgi:hypothetical protein